MFLLAERYSAADYAFHVSCATSGGRLLPIRKTRNALWIAPDGTTSFKAGDDMTNAPRLAGYIRTPKTEGEYRIYSVDSDGKIISKSAHILRLSGSSDVIEAEDYNEQSGIQTENCSEGGSDVAYIENGDYICFKNIDLKNAETINFRVASSGSNGRIYVYIRPPRKLMHTVCQIFCHMTKSLVIRRTLVSEEVY